MRHGPVVQSEAIDELYSALLNMKTVDELYSFFEDLCTINEIKAIAQRFHVAKMLESGAAYHEVVEKTHASTATISRINRCLVYGAGGYKLAIERLRADEENKEKA